MIIQYVTDEGLLASIIWIPLPTNKSVAQKRPTRASREEEEHDGKSGTTPGASDGADAKYRAVVTRPNRRRAAADGGATQRIRSRAGAPESPRAREPGGHEQTQQHL